MSFRFKGHPLQKEASYSGEGWKSLIYGYRDMYLEGSLILCPFSNVIVVYSPLGFVHSPVIDSWIGLQYQAWIPSCEAILKSIKKTVGYS